MAYAGIDYSLGKSNFDPITGIHFGVIAMNSINLDYTSDFENEYGDATCPECGSKVKASDDTTLFADYDGEDLDDDGTPEWFDGKDYTCVDCKACYWSDDVTPDEAIGWSYDRDGYKLTDCLDTDIFVLASPYYTFAQFCSPCVPGAGNLDNAMEPEEGVKTFCLGHDWFDDDKAPYRVFSVADGSEVLAAAAA